MRTAGEIRVRRDGAAALVEVANPARRNAVTFAMWGALADAVAVLDADPEVRAVTLAGEGEHFVSGADISEFDAIRDGADAVADYDRAVDRATAALAGSATPTLARIRGVCVGGGLALAMACDLRIAADDARFAIPAARLGIAYPPADVRRLVGLVGPAAARDLLFTARAVGAAEAAAMGLVNRVVPAADLDAAAEEATARLVAAAPLSIAASRAAIAAALPGAGEREVRAAAEAAARAAGSEDYAEGRRAFAEKRPPVFRGR
jgi:enoyl-CoA hydratase